VASEDRGSDIEYENRIYETTQRSMTYGYK